MASSTVSLKLLIDSKEKRVLFAEGSEEFVDFLFNIMSLPVGTVIRLLNKQGMVGCLGNLYESIGTLSDTYIQPNLSKESILNPKVVSSASNVPRLLPNMEESASTPVFYNCGSSYNCYMYMTHDPKAKCPQCQRLMNTQITLVEAPKKQGTSGSSSEGGYVKGVVAYMIMDNLVVRPMSTISSIAILNKFNVKEVGALEEKMVDLTMDVGVKLLKAALQTKNALTDVFLKK